MRVETQWRHGFDGPSGLDYNAVDVVLKRFPVDDEPAVWEGLQIMEKAALKAMK